jgi:CubicO group peptidase (beta-lactamase class C family)
MAKSFASTLVGVAIDEGYIKSVDESITNYIPELLGKDERFKAITIRNLLTMSSGIKYEDGGDLPWSEEADDTKTYYSTDLRELALNCRIEGKPGEYFEYNNYNPLLMGMILERATGMRVSRYLQEKLWKPVGMEADGSWSLDSTSSGFEKMESGVNARARDFARFGMHAVCPGGQLGGQAAHLLRLGRRVHARGHEHGSFPGLPVLLVGQHARQRDFPLLGARLRGGW